MLWPNATRRKIMAMLVEGNIPKKKSERSLVSPCSTTIYKCCSRQVWSNKGRCYSSNRIWKELHGDQGREAYRGQEGPFRDRPCRSNRPAAIALHRRCIQISHHRSAGAGFGGALKLLEPLFPGPGTSERIGALIIQKGNVLITLYSNRQT